MSWFFIIAYYGYADGSGEYYVAIDFDKCDGCGKCIKKCPQSALELIPQFIDLEDKVVASVSKENRKKIKYICSSCKPDISRPSCAKFCDKEAISIIWKPSWIIHFLLWK